MKSGKNANLGGQWKALLGGGSTTAISRTSPAAGSIAVDVNGVTVINMASSGFWTKLNNANNSACVNNSTPFITVASNTDELGAAHNSSDSYFWNGTQSNGSNSNNHCANWTSNAAAPTYGTRGYPTCTGSLWIDYGLNGCDTPTRLMCISAD